MSRVIHVSATFQRCGEEDGPLDFDQSFIKGDADAIKKFVDNLGNSIIEEDKEEEVVDYFWDGNYPDDAKEDIEYEDILEKAKEGDIYYIQTMLSGFYGASMHLKEIKSLDDL